ncbi:MAG: DUF4375 domain-containing protein [Planctomycetales bacterium]
MNEQTKFRAQPAFALTGILVVFALGTLLVWLARSFRHEDRPAARTNTPTASKNSPMTPPAPSSPWSYGSEQKVGLLFLCVDEGAGLDQVSHREKIIWIVSWCGTELRNGGTNQVFWNFGAHIPDAIEAFESIGAPESAATLRRACSLFPNGQPSTDDEIRREQIQRIYERDNQDFEQFDGQWFEEDVFGLLLDFWRKHEPAAVTVPTSKRLRSEALRLLVDLPIVEKGDYEKLSDRERYLWDICSFAALADVMGCVSTYFSSPNAEHAPRLLTGLEQIGATHTAAIVRNICSFNPKDSSPSDLLKGMGLNFSIRDGELSGMLKRMQRQTDVADYAQRAFGDVKFRDGVVTHGALEEDLYALLLKYWKDHE